MIVRVVIPGQASFDYSVPVALESTCQVGVAVEVRLGPRVLIGYVSALLEQSPHQLRPIQRIIEEIRPLGPQALKLAEFVADYYLADLAEVLALVVPAPNRRRVLEQLRLTDLGKERAANDPELARVKQVRTVKSLASRLGWTLTATRARIEQWQQAGLVSSGSKLSLKAALGQRATTVDHGSKHALRPDQLAALGQLDAAQDSGEYRGFLLWGVTGSGKTEVYLATIAHALARGRTALVLVPEIGLTPQVAERFTSRFGDDVVTLHSALSDKSRRSAWARVERGDARVVVGPRSALFAPVEDLGVIIVDEEHDDSYKQEDSPRYHARDVALVRARLHGAIAVLGSATPSLETLHNVERQKLELLKLNERATGGLLPEVEIVTLGPPVDRNQPRPKARAKSGRDLDLLSPRLTEAMVTTVGRGEQVILFLNRRGFAPFVLCTSCGQGFRCPNCSVSLTHHLHRDVLECHYCGHTEKTPVGCPFCQSPALRTLGSGTERLEGDLKQTFPRYRIARLDRDVAQSPKQLLATLEAFRAGSIDILVGTQMVTKGHDFPNVTLVGVIFADAALNFPDFRAAERATQQLVQVAGRAGRADKKGRVIVQTFFPDHPALLAAQSHDYAGFAGNELIERRELDYPPFSRMLLIRGESENQDELKTVMNELKTRLDECAGLVAEPTPTVLGPAPAPIERLRGKFRILLLLKGRQASQLRQMVGQALKDWRWPRSTKLVLDADPVSML